MDHLLETVLQLEHQVWSALVEGDTTADERLLADEFLGVYGSGFAAKAEHSGQLAHGPTIAHYALTEARVIQLSDQIVLLSYLAHYARQQGDDVGEPEAMYVTSIWRQSADGEWQNIFSQDTAKHT